MNTTSNNSISEISNLNKITSQINTNLLIVESAIGLPLNLVSIFIFWRIMGNKTNMGFLGIIQCTIDFSLLALCLFALRSSQLLFTVSFANQTNTLCKLLTFLRRFSIHVSSWISVIVTFDRFVFVLFGYSHRFRLMKSKAFLGFLITSVFLIIAVLDIPNLYFYLNKDSCMSDFPIRISTDVISICLRTYFPLALMLVFNLSMIISIFRTVNSTSFSRPSISRREYQFTVSVMAYDLYFFICNFPMSIYYIFYDVNSYSGALADQLFSAKYSLVNAVVTNLALFQQTFSFFMFVGFNTIYRRQLLSLFKKGRSANLRITQDNCT